MAYIRKMTDKPRELPWRAQVRRSGRVLVRMFATREEAEHWAQEQERSFRMTGLPLSIDALKGKPVREIIDRYLRDITPSKGCRRGEKIVLKRFNARYGDYPLAGFTRQDAWEYIDQRKKEKWRDQPITMRTIGREIASLRNVWSVAQERWKGYESLANPWSKLKLKGTSHRRMRRLQDGELKLIEDQIDQTCHNLNRFYAPIAIYLAIETGMRLQEIFNLAWEDIDFKKRRIHIYLSKTDHVSESSGRELVLPFLAGQYLTELFLAIHNEGHLHLLRGRIFPMSKEAFGDLFNRLCKGAGLKADKRNEMLQFRDLRREAGSRFDEAGLTQRENEIMLGHTDGSTNSIYIQSKLKIIQDKLDRHVLNGKTLDETLKDALANTDLDTAIAEAESGRYPILGKWVAWLKSINAVPHSSNVILPFKRKGAV